MSTVRAGLAHVLAYFLGHVLWKDLAQVWRAAGLGDEPRRVFDELDTISPIDVILTTRASPKLRHRCITRRTDHQVILLQHLGQPCPLIVEGISCNQRVGKLYLAPRVNVHFIFPKWAIVPNPGES